jgi:HSP20 family protein
MNITRYQGNLPFALHDEIRNFFDRFFDDIGADNDESAVVTAQWMPRVDIREEADRFVISADLPGVDPKDVEVLMDRGMLSICGERRSETVTEKGRFTRVERRHGRFHRRFALPDSADPDGITATGRHGVLEITIPKKPETTPRRIQVDTGPAE